MSSTPDNILFLAYYYPPIQSPGVKRSFALSTHCRPYFDQVTVLTTANRRVVLTTDQKIPEDIRVVEVPTLDYRRIAARLTGNRESKEAALKKRPAGRLFLKAMRSFPVNLLIGEGGLVYILSAYRIAKKILKAHPDTVIYSSFSPWADHIVAWLLKRKYPHLIWIADFRDLHVDPIFRNYLWKNLQLWFDRKITARASLVTTVSEGLAIHLRRFHHNVAVFPNGVLTIPPKAHHYPDKFTIAYTGAMFRDRRRPHLLLRALQELFMENKLPREHIRLLQAGRDAGLWRDFAAPFGLEDIIELRGVLPQQDARRIQSRAHINLMLTASHPEYKGVLTSKIYEYLAAGNPIITLVNGPRDELLEQALHGIDHLFIAYDGDDTAPLKAFILTLFRRWRQSDYPSIPPTQWTDRYHWPAIAGRFTARIWDLINAQPRVNA